MRCPVSAPRAEEQFHCAWPICWSESALIWGLHAGAGRPGQAQAYRRVTYPAIAALVRRPRPRGVADCITPHLWLRDAGERDVAHRDGDGKVEAEPASNFVPKSEKDCVTSSARIAIAEIWPDDIGPVPDLSPAGTLA